MVSVVLAMLALTMFAGASFGTVGSPTVRKAASVTYKMAVVTDVGGLNDHGFNQAANAGRLLVQKKLGFQTRVFDTRSAAERLPNLQAAAQDGYQQEAGYLVGYLAGLVLKQQPGPDVASAIGANTVPAIVRYFGGYRAGVKKADPKATVILSYANDPTFSDQAKCKEVALNQISQKTQIIFTAAGGCGLGALDQAKSQGLWGIGVDSDQLYLGPEMLTSALKDVAKSVYLTSQEFKKSPAKFKTGFNKVFNVKNGGIGYGKVSTKLKNRAAIIKKVNKIKKLIAAGKIVPPAK